MKYYIYISDAKIEMLLPQVPHTVKKKIATEFGIDLKLLSAKRKSEVETEESRISKLETVVTYIREYGNLGSVDEPDSYIEDTLPMKSGTLGGNLKDGAPLVYFGGETNKTVMGLFGSAKHMVGASGVPPAPAGSTTNFILAYLQGTIQTEQTEVFEAIHQLLTSMKSPPEQLEFLAKRLLYEPHFSRRGGKKGPVILATPLYVAKAD